MFFNFFMFCCSGIKQLFDVSDRAYIGRFLKTSVEFH